MLTACFLACSYQTDILPLSCKMFVLFCKTNYTAKLFAHYATNGQTETDRQTDRQTDKSNAYFSLPYGRGHNIRLSKTKWKLLLGKQKITFQTENNTAKPKL